eukprot:gb/GECG01015243.1/.p1 GENE.gb/GECG01015243.1/~~gb/GECG01015243.1/.p1  ORF type:complete len:206 (+),score=24.73 gb/GECG01015243.1/:1-618(+)
MSLDPNQFTQKTNEAISSAQSLAHENACSQGISPLHVLSALLDDSNGLAPRVFRKAEVDVNALKSAVDQHVSNLPRQDPAPEEAQPRSSLIKVLRNASQLQKSSTGDTYLSVDHLLSALLSDSAVKKALKEAKVDTGKVQEAIKEVKGNKQATRYVLRYPGFLTFYLSNKPRKNNKKGCIGKVRGDGKLMTSHRVTRVKHSVSEP